jgi:hypothetical protein
MFSSMLAVFAEFRGVAVVEIGDRHHRGAERRPCPGARSPWFAAKASVLR